MVWPFTPKQPSQQELMANMAAEWDKKIAPLIANSSLQGVRGNDAVSRYISGQYHNADRLHQIYEDFGYPETLNFNHFWNIYRRFGMAKTVVDTIVDICWTENPIVNGSDQFNSDLEKLTQKVNVWNRLNGLDKRQRVGSYAGAFIEVRDDKNPGEPMEKVSTGVESIANIKPIYEGQLVVNQFDEYGNPTMYQFQPSATGTRNPDELKTVQIHPTRVIVWAEDADDGSIYGVSALESVFNDLMDLRKITGASAEGGYQNSRNVPVFTADPNYQAPQDGTPAKDKFDKAIEEWLNKWQKRLVLAGIEPHFNNVTIPNPKETYQACLNNIAAGSKLPQAILTGQITGVLAGDKDSKHLLMRGKSRQENFLTEGISQFIDWCMMYGVLPTSDYEIEWPDLMAMSDEEKLQNAFKMAETNARNSGVTGGGLIYSEEEIREAGGMEPESEPPMPDETLDDEDEL